MLRGRVDHIDRTTGELLHRYTTVHGTGGFLPIACKTRRASRCPPCADVYRDDTYHPTTLSALRGDRAIHQRERALAAGLLRDLDP